MTAKSWCNILCILFYQLMVIFSVCFFELERDSSFKKIFKIHSVIAAENVRKEHFHVHSLIKFTDKKSDYLQLHNFSILILIWYIGDSTK